MTLPNWKDALPSPPTGGQLQAAWMTTFDQPDASLLVEHLLPSLLGTSHTLSQELQERKLFFGELGMALESLHGQLTVISSPPRASRVDPQYPWLWRYVSHFTVGAEARAVQHSKLWAFHWRVGNEELLELHVSSTNLTASALKEQVQAGWQITLPLGARPTLKARRSWGKLVPFLEALGASAGEIATSRLARLIELISRAQCPDDITFISSIPGHIGAARQLKQLEPSELHILVPTVGEWNEQTLSAWSIDIGIPLNKVHLKWISQDHPWATTSDKGQPKPNWVMSTSAADNLMHGGIRIERLPTRGRLADKHRDADPRWSHAKLYLIRSRNRKKRRLLVTSANWSISAWGAGKAASRNFELGVAFESEWKELEGLEEPLIRPFCVDRVDNEELSSSLEWAEAKWDGQYIELRVRSTDSQTPISALVKFSNGSEKNINLTNGRSTIPWGDPENTPLTALFEQMNNALEINILDLRIPSEFAKTPLPEVDPGTTKALREAFLLQRYGGPVVAPELIADLGSGNGLANVTPPNADYAVPTWIDARAAFSVVDKWQKILEEAATEAGLVERIKMDGEELCAFFKQRDDPASMLVAEELSWRLSQEA